MSALTTLFQEHINNRFWRVNILPIAASLVIGPLLAFLIVEEQYLYALAFLFAVPVAVGLNRYPLTALIVWFVFVPLVPADGSSTRYLYWVFHMGLIPMAVGINIVSRMVRLKPHPPVRLGFVDVAMVAYGVVVVYSVLFNSDILISEMRPYLTTFYARMVVPFFIYWLIRFTAPTDDDLRPLVYVAMFLLICEAVIGLVGWFDSSLTTYWQGVNSSAATRTVGTFGAPGPYTAALMICTIIVLQYGMTKATGYLRLFCIFLVGLGMVCIFFSFSRGSWVAAIAVGGVMWYLYPKVIQYMALAGFLVMTVLLSTYLSDELLYAVERLNASQSAGSRLILGRAGQQMFLERPLFGWGYGTYDVHDWKFVERVGEFVPREYEIKQGTSHNSYLTILAETGIVGFSLYIFPFVWWFVLLIRILPKLRKNINPNEFLNQKFLILMWSNIGFVIIIAQFIDIRFFWFVIGELWLSLGIAANLTERFLKMEESS